VLAEVTERLPAVEDGQPAGGLELEQIDGGAEELELGTELLRRQGLHVTASSCSNNALRSWCAAAVETSPRPPFNMTQFYHSDEQTYGLNTFRK